MLIEILTLMLNTSSFYLAYQASLLNSVNVNLSVEDFRFSMFTIISSATAVVYYTNFSFFPNNE